MSAAAPPPPPPGPPPFQADLDAVYRPDEDPALTSCVGARSSPHSEALVFGDFEEPQLRTDAGLARGSKQSSAALLIDLDDSSGGAPSEPGAGADAAQPAGLLADLPAGVSLSAVEGGAAYIDLSAPRLPASSAAPAAGGAAAASRAPAGAGAAGGAASRDSGLPVLPDAAGFGSDDLFGSKERNLGEELRGEAAAAWSSVVRNLPQEVKTQIPDCMAPPPEDPSLELNFTAEANARQGLPGHGLPAQAGGAPVTADQHHAAMAVNRACEGRWVPTYMRHQMAQNGHHALPTAAAPNAHEFAAGTPMPSVQQTLDEMGNDVQEAAQTMVAFVIAFLSSLATQCQMCSHQTATTMHDQVVSFGEGMCNGATVEEEFTEERVAMGPLLPESAAGYGPMRSRATRPASPSRGWSAS
ncbi:unnamed protein product [Prorocentrum cordatum]|uniref:Uncharacterized protein n=1 Tax=Prorocentrum cordatum TaxID=2364126 RepID=A0ABN9US00_9DINO|nr:unnamed protein product [Polarella glacialis]